MAYIGPWGCYVHIPKTGGVWVKRVLGKIQVGHQDGLGHGLPLKWGDYENIFCTTRHPAQWLASAWAHRVRHQWDSYSREVPWKYFCEITRVVQSDQFPEFVDNVIRDLPGLIGWFWGMHISPLVRPIRLDNVSELLKAVGGDPDAIPPQNVGSNAPKITEDIYDKIWEVEKETYFKYGYNKLPYQITEV